MNPALQFLAVPATGVFALLSFMLFLAIRKAAWVAGSRQWLFGVLSVVAGVVLGLMPASAPDWISRVPSNAFILAGWLQVALGTFTYRTHRSVGLLPATTLFCACLLTFGYFSYINPHYSARVVIFTTLQGGIFALHAWAALLGTAPYRHADWVRNKRMAAGHWLLLLAACCVMLNVAMRGAETWQNMSAVLPETGASNTTLRSYAIGVLLWSAVFVSLVLILIAELESSLRALANSDALTKALNRRGLEEAAARLPAKQQHSLLSFDIDHFKAINDEFGHEAGDQIIELLVACARRVLPANTILARTGGEEFCFILPDTALPAASSAAALVRADFAHRSAAICNGASQTASAGLVCADKGQFNLAELQRLADQALYRAKNSGRDQVVVA